MQSLIDAIFDECPRRILGLLHTRGEYRHRIDAAGLVRCFHRDADAAALPPSPAQEALWDAQARVAAETESS